MSLLGIFGRRVEGARDAAELNGLVAAIDRAQAVIEFGLDGSILHANQNFLNVMGYALEEIRGQHHRMFVDPAQRDTPDYRAFWERLSRGEFNTPDSSGASARAAVRSGYRPRTTPSFVLMAAS